MRFACLTATVVFTVFTYWQFNDLEQYGTRLWLGWVFTYGSVAVASAAFAIPRIRPLPWGVYASGAIAAAFAAAILMTDIDWEGPILYNPSNPAGNEAGGLLIVFIWLAFLASRAAARAKT